MTADTTLITCFIVDKSETRPRYRDNIELHSFLIPHNEISQDDHKILNMLGSSCSITAYDHKTDHEIKFLLATGNSLYIYKGDKENRETRIKYSVWEDRWKKYRLDIGNRFPECIVAKVIIARIETMFELEDIL